MAQITQWQTVCAASQPHEKRQIWQLDYSPPEYIEVFYVCTESSCLLGRNRRTKHIGIIQLKSTNYELLNPQFSGRLSSSTSHPSSPSPHLIELCTWACAQSSDALLLERFSSTFEQKLPSADSKIQHAPSIASPEKDSALPSSFLASSSSSLFSSSITTPRRMSNSSLQPSMSYAGNSMSGSQASSPLPSISSLHINRESSSFFDRIFSKRKSISTPVGEFSDNALDAVSGNTALASIVPPSPDMTPPYSLAPASPCSPHLLSKNVSSPSFIMTSHSPISKSGIFAHTRSNSFGKQNPFSPSSPAAMNILPGRVSQSDSDSESEAIEAIEAAEIQTSAHHNLMPLMPSPPPSPHHSARVSTTLLSRPALIRPPSSSQTLLLPPLPPIPVHDNDDDDHHKPVHIPRFASAPSPSASSSLFSIPVLEHPTPPIIHTPIVPPLSKPAAAPMPWEAKNKRLQAAASSLQEEVPVDPSGYEAARKLIAASAAAAATPAPVPAPAPAVAHPGHPAAEPPMQSTPSFFSTPVPTAANFARQAVPSVPSSPPKNINGSSVVVDDNGIVGIVGDSDEVLAHSLKKQKQFEEEDQRRQKLVAALPPPPWASKAVAAKQRQTPAVISDAFPSPAAAAVSSFAGTPGILFPVAPLQPALSKPSIVPVTGDSLPYGVAGIIGDSDEIYEQVLEAQQEKEMDRLQQQMEEMRRPNRPESVASSSDYLDNIIKGNFRVRLQRVVDGPRHQQPEQNQPQQPKKATASPRAVVPVEFVRRQAMLRKADAPSQPARKPSFDVPSATRRILNDDQDGHDEEEKDDNDDDDDDDEQDDVQEFMMEPVLPEVDSRVNFHFSKKTFEPTPYEQTKTASSAFREMQSQYQTFQSSILQSRFDQGEAEEEQDEEEQLEAYMLEYAENDATLQYASPSKDLKSKPASLHTSSNRHSNKSSSNKPSPFHTHAFSGFPQPIPIARASHAVSSSSSPRAPAPVPSSSIPMKSPRMPQPQPEVVISPRAAHSKQMKSGQPAAPIIASPRKTVDTPRRSNLEEINQSISKISSFDVIRQGRDRQMQAALSAYGNGELKPNKDILYKSRYSRHQQNDEYPLENVLMEENVDGIGSVLNKLSRTVTEFEHWKPMMEFEVPNDLILSKGSPKYISLSQQKTAGLKRADPVARHSSQSALYNSTHGLLPSPRSQVSSLLSPRGLRSSVSGAASHAQQHRMPIMFS